MDTTIKVFRLIIIILAVLPLSCATRLTSPLSRLDDTHSIVFGKIEVTADGQPIYYDSPVTAPKNPDPVVQCHISHYVSDAKLNKDMFKPGEYSFRTVVNQDGYFSFLIPPGKYYFVELDYSYVFSSDPNIGARTYMNKNPFLMTFDAAPDKAVYIGTIQNNFM